MTTIYSADNTYRVDLTETAEGIEYRFWQLGRVMEQRGVNVALLDPADLPACHWRQIERGFLPESDPQGDPIPFHRACDSLYRLVRPMSTRSE